MCWLAGRGSRCFVLFLGLFFFFLPPVQHGENDSCEERRRSTAASTLSLGISLNEKEDVVKIQPVLKNASYGATPHLRDKIKNVSARLPTSTQLTSRPTSPADSTQTVDSLMVETTDCPLRGTVILQEDGDPITALL